MSEDIHLFGENPFGKSLEGLIPAVDPVDLRSVWEMQREVQARRSGQHTAINAEFYKRACSPGAMSARCGSGLRCSECWKCSECSRLGHTRAYPPTRCSKLPPTSQ